MKKKEDHRLKNILCEFGDVNLGSERFLKTLVEEMHRRISELELRVYRRSGLNPFTYDICVVAGESINEW